MRCNFWQHFIICLQCNFWTLSITQFVHLIFQVRQSKICNSNWNLYCVSIGQCIGYTYNVDLIKLYIFNKGPILFLHYIFLSYVKFLRRSAHITKKLSWPQIDTKRLTSANNETSTQHGFMSEKQKKKEKENI